MKILFLLQWIMLVCTMAASAQNVGIGTATPNASAALDVQSTTKGFLPPRMNSVQRKAVASPANGLIVFDTDANQLFLYDGSGWQALSGGQSSNLLYPSQTTQPGADRTFKGYFGMDAAMSASYAVAGAPNADSGTKSNTGTIYVYKKGTSGAWTTVAKLYASDPQTNSYFGSTVALAGNFIVVGASGLGKVYVFVKGSGDTWTQQTTFTQPSNGITSYEFGYYLSISVTSIFGPAIIVGTPSTTGSGNSRGAAYIYRFNGTAWSLQQTLLPNDLSDNDSFGQDVDIDGDYCVVGAPYQNNAAYNISHAGAAYVFVFGGGVWGLQQKLSGYAANAAFGSAISLQNDVVAIGAPRAAYYAGSTSSVYVFQRSLASWNQLASLYFSSSSGFPEGSFFGQSVSLDSNNLVIGIPGGIKFHNLGSLGGSPSNAVAIYKKYSNGSGFYLSKLIHDTDPLPSESGSIYFGNSVSIKNGNYVIGIPAKNVGEIANAGTIAFGYIE